MLNCFPFAFAFPPFPITPVPENQICNPKLCEPVSKACRILLPRNNNSLLRNTSHSGDRIPFYDKSFLLSYAATVLFFFFLSFPPLSPFLKQYHEILCFWEDDLPQPSRKYSSWVEYLVPTPSPPPFFFWKIYSPLINSYGPNSTYLHSSPSSRHQV